MTWRRNFHTTYDYSWLGWDEGDLGVVTLCFLQLPLAAAATRSLGRFPALPMACCHFWAKPQSLQPSAGDKLQLCPGVPQSFPLFAMSHSPQLGSRPLKPHWPAQAWSATGGRQSPAGEVPIALLPWASQQGTDHSGAEPRAQGMSLWQHSPFPAPSPGS